MVPGITGKDRMESEAMTSKEQERQALAEIKAILLQLEPDGYVRTAFEGCFEIAEDNIQNDFACSMKQRAESAEERVKQLTWENERISKVSEELRRDLEGTQKELDIARKEKDEMNLNMARENIRVVELYNTADKENRELKHKLKTRDAEIMYLKAKLYDLLITKEEGNKCPEN